MGAPAENNGADVKSAPPVETEAPDFLGAKNIEGRSVRAAAF
jgi:hypothetical protein